MANQEHLDIFWQGSDVWSKWIVKNPDIKPDLSYADLNGVDLSDSTFNGDMSYANLSGANLTKATFFLVNLSEAIFQKTNFIRSVFIPHKPAGFAQAYAHIGSYKNFVLGNTNLSHANLSDSNMTNFSFSSGVIFKGARFEKANIIEAIFKEFNLEEIDLSGANLIELDLRSFNLKSYCLMNCDLSKSDLSGMDLSNINFESTNLSNAKLIRVNLSNANLTKAILKDSDLEYANLNYTNLNKSDCEGVNLNKADLSYSCFFKANMRRANLYQSKCYQTDFREANLESSLFGYSDCLRASFYQANLRSSVFNGANITFANFQQANLQKSFFYAANAIDCNFFNADLTDACLAAMRGIDANFSEANLTGVCIEDWNINTKTKLQNILCNFVYNKSGWDDDGEFLPSDRLPHDPAINFKVGEFERFIQKAQNTVDLIFTNGIDWQAFLQAFLKLKSETGDELSIYSIEDKWDGYFVVRVNVPPDADKKEIETLLKVKDTQIEGYRRENTNLLNLLQTALQQPSQAFHAPVYGVAGNLQGDQKIYPLKPDNIQGNYNENEE
jgi:uncharacterized protein YjbI with pentapeptide repeats